MAKIRAKGTKPEMRVRRQVYSMGFRYRLHVRDLPGKPDLVFKGKKKAIFVHGCFWHSHENCKKARLPKSSIEYWYRKIHKNKERDAKNIYDLTTLGWKVLVIWECETENSSILNNKIHAFLQ